MEWFQFFFLKLSKSEMFFNQNKKLNEEKIQNFVRFYGCEFYIGVTRLKWLISISGQVRISSGDCQGRFGPEPGNNFEIFFENKFKINLNKKNIFENFIFIVLLSMTLKAWVKSTKFRRPAPGEWNLAPPRFSLSLFPNYVRSSHSN